MRITLGGVLVVVGVAGATAYFSLDPSRINGVTDKVQEAVHGAMSLVGLFKSGAQTSNEVYSPPPPFPGAAVGSSTAGVTSSSVPGSTVPATAALSTSSAPFVPAVAVAPTPDLNPTPVPAKKGSKKKRRKRVATISTPVAQKKTVHRKSRKPVPAKAAQSTVPGLAKKGDLMGSYVSLELITGRSVQGILEGKTPTHYVLNVPGLGPLEYPVENVKSVQPAQ